LRRSQLPYIIPVSLSLLIAGLLTWWFLPAGLRITTLLVVIIPVLIVAVGFQIITYKRLKIIRLQLYQILQTLEEFDIDEPKKVAFEESPFSLFNELNEYLIELIDRIRTNYQANKQFTQNASHELQTPLAIIKGHVELLLQSPRVGEKEIHSLGLVLQNTNRLSKLNKALILLSKIEHQRFVDTEKVNFAQVTDEMLENFHDLIQIQEIEIRKNYAQPFETDMSLTLAEILVANLLQNAIRHNVPEGFIEIEMDRNHFSVRNTGAALKGSPDLLFKRFKRKSTVEESLGLGLSIVKKICEQSGLTVSYQYEDRVHTLRVKW